MRWLYRSKYLPKLCLIFTYAAYPLILFEYIVLKRVIIVIIIGIFVALYLRYARDFEGNEIFIEKNAAKFGPFYYFPLSLADKVANHRIKDTRP
jgi:hypothetical protein